jgi:hypothetical protein
MIGITCRCSWVSMARTTSQVWDTIAAHPESMACAAGPAPQ